MSRFRIYAVFAVILFAMADASAKRLSFPVTVLTAESHQFQAPPLDPPNCTLRDFDAYCHHSSPVTYVEKTMVIREPSGQSVEIACTVYTHWSHCADLRVNQTFQATEEKRGLDIRYLDDRHKWRKELYEIVGENRPLVP